MPASPQSAKLTAPFSSLRAAAIAQQPQPGRDPNRSPVNLLAVAPKDVFVVPGPRRQRAPPHGAPGEERATLSTFRDQLGRAARLRGEPIPQPEGEHGKAGFPADWVTHVIGAWNPRGESTALRGNVKAMRGVRKLCEGRAGLTVDVPFWMRRTWWQKGGLRDWSSDDGAPRPLAHHADPGELLAPRPPAGQGGR